MPIFSKPYAGTHPHIPCTESLPARSSGAHNGNHLLSLQRMHSSRVCEMLHCHRVNLRHLACREYHIHKRNLFCRRIRLECMARLMSQNINVRARTIKVGEDERRLERIQKCAVTACLFSRLRPRSNSSCSTIKSKNSPRLFRQLMVHLLRLRNQFLRRSFRNRISFRENQLPHRNNAAGPL